jgi:GTP-binding protein
MTQDNATTGTTPAAGAGADALSALALETGDTLFRQPWTFLKSAPAAEFLPEADRAEIAFAGRSNVGKSSLINALVNQHGLARTSNTPGRTQELNYFLTERAPLYLVDMPGYGFAQAPKSKVDNWTELVKGYLRGRPTLARVFLLIDSRHGIKPVDREIMALLNEAAVSFQVVLTKIDKLKTTDAEAMIAATLEALSREPAAFPRIVATSSEKMLGVPELRAELAIAAGFVT